MLVLTRKIGDVIAIGDDIKIVVISVRGKQVRLGIKANKDTVIHRQEIYEIICNANKEAMQLDYPTAQAADGILKRTRPLPTLSGVQQPHSDADWSEKSGATEDAPVKRSNGLIIRHRRKEFHKEEWDSAAEPE